MRVLWTDAAIAQLQAIYTYLAETSPEYALRLIDCEVRPQITQITQITKTVISDANRAISP